MTPRKTTLESDIGPMACTTSSNVGQTKRNASASFDGQGGLSQGGGAGGARGRAGARPAAQEAADALRGEIGGDQGPGGWRGVLLILAAGEPRPGAALAL